MKNFYKIFLTPVFYRVCLVGLIYFSPLQNLHATQSAQSAMSGNGTSVANVADAKDVAAQDREIKSPSFTSPLENEHIILSIKQYITPSSDDKKNAGEGTSLVTDFQFSLKKNLHINATEVTDPAFIPTRANLTGEGITNLWIQPSSAEEKAYFGQTLSVYEEGPHNITIYSSFSKNGVVQNFTFNYQPCTDKICYPPKTLSFTQTLKKEDLPIANKNFSTPSAEINSSKKWPLLLAFFLAFLGGIILNFMPCVFPILSLKIFSLVKVLQSENSSSVRKTSLYYFLGVLFFFLILASLVALPNEETVWGFQFQYSSYLVTMAIICWALGLEIGETTTFSSYFARLFQPMTKWFSQKENPLKHFLSGGFFVLMSTPCIAPFLGTAILYAFGRSLVEIYYVFFGISLGFSLPFILISLGFSSKRLQSIMPTSGAWMKKLKVWLSLPMFVTSLWLFSLLLSNSNGLDISNGTALTQDAAWLAFIKTSNFAAPVLVLLLLATLILPAVYRWKKKSSSASSSFSPLPPAAFFVLLGISMIIFLISTLEKENKAILAWENLDAKSIGQLNGREGIVYVHVTADWCITCRINEFKVLEKQETKALLERYNVTLLRGDLTSKNEVVDSYMQQLGFVGIPLDIIYPKEGNRKPIVLPTFFSKQQLEQAIIQAQ